MSAATDAAANPVRTAPDAHRRGRWRCLRDGVRGSGNALRAAINERRDVCVDLLVWNGSALRRGSETSVPRRRTHVLVESLVRPMKAIDCAVINKSTLVSDSDLLQWTIACVKQAREHAAPLWGWPTPVAHWLPDSRFIKSDMDVLYLFDDSDAPGALGWHDVDDAGRPFGKVFARTTMENGTSVSSCLSHELLELCGDPNCNDFRSAPDGVEWALELCDQVEADCYDIDGVQVSNFLTPAAFLPAQEGARYDYLGVLSAPFTIAPGGYAIVRDPKTGQISQSYGENRDAWRAKGKEHPAARTARRLAGKHV